ncbi:MAG TPA: cation:proton antiporter [Gemmatimonadaceae bacterium]
MDSNVWLVASVWMGLALLASIISIRIGVSVALIEILVGILAGNLFRIHSAPWIDFLATFGSGLLTFLAGAEIDPGSLRRHLKPALTIGAVSFLIPFLVAGAFAYWAAHWDRHASYIAGIALSTTSVAVVYAVMIETGLSRSELGKLILAACFVTDFGTVLALGIIFANFNGWLALFVGVTALVLWYLPRLTRFVIRSVGHRISEPEVKFLFLVLFLLGGLAKIAQSEAVLPAYLVGLVIAGVFVHDRILMDRMRSIAFSILTPFYFIRAGLYVSLPGIATGALLIVAFLMVKMISKFVGVMPLTVLFRFDKKEGLYTTLLMSTGLTFGTISALFGLTNKIITQAQYTILVTTVIGSAIVPTLLAQRFFQPSGPYFETTEEDIETMDPPEERTTRGAAPAAGSSLTP